MKDDHRHYIMAFWSLNLEHFGFPESNHQSKIEWKRSTRRKKNLILIQALSKHSIFSVCNLIILIIRFIYIERESETNKKNVKINDKNYRHQFFVFLHFFFSLSLFKFVNWPIINPSKLYIYYTTIGICCFYFVVVKDFLQKNERRKSDQKQHRILYINDNHCFLFIFTGFFVLFIHFEWTKKQNEYNAQMTWFFFSIVYDYPWFSVSMDSC